MEVTNIQNLQNEYARLEEEYARLADDALNATSADVLNPIVETIKSTNQSIRAVLDQMLTVLAQMKEETPDISVYSDELVKRLGQIQNDYNNLKSNTDKLETLRRIRAYEESKATGSLNWYLLGFLVLCGILVVFILIFGRQRSADATYAMPTSPMMTAPLT